MTKQKILVIEDDNDIATTLQYLLEAEGYSVDIASTGEEGLRKVRHEMPCLVLLDLFLPKMPGEQVCKVIRKEETLRHLPLIMLTSKDSDVDRIIGRVIGADYYITKPFDAHYLLKVIRDAIGKRG